MISIIYCPHPYFRQHNQLKMNRFPHVWYIIDSMVHTISPKYEWSQTKNMASSPQFTHFSDKMSLYPNICIAIVTNLINKWFGTSLFCHCSQNVTIGVVTIGGRGLLHPWGVPLVNPSENSICTCLLQVSLHSVMCPIHLLCHSLPALSLLQKCPKSYCTVLSEACNPGQLNWIETAAHAACVLIPVWLPRAACLKQASVPEVDHDTQGQENSCKLEHGWKHWHYFSHTSNYPNGWPLW